tara:strand:+ start:390 stop:545 length:156 start_codon:yes stop_codon:yes gene_type:complete
MNELHYMYAIIMFVLWFSIWTDINEIKWQLKKNYITRKTEYGARYGKEVEK